jgi:PhnB protein
MQLEPYLFFEGRCEEAIEFYRTALGAQVEALIRFKDAPGGQSCGPDVKPDAVMHARIRVGDTSLMASDGACSSKAQFQGFSLSITVEGDAEAKRVFDALAQGGEVRMPLAPTFFATSFGMVADRFGVSWMVYAPVAQVKEAARKATAIA